MEKLQLFDLTHAQKRIYDVEQFYKGTCIANIGGTFLLKENLDFTIWERAINKVIQENDALRIRIKEIDYIPKQYTADYQYVKLEYKDFTNVSHKEYEKWALSKMAEPFDLYDSNLFEIIMIKSPSGECGGFARLHHLISDGWSVGFLPTRSIENYELIQSNKNEYSVSYPSYIDYVISEKEYLSSDKCNKDKEYWLSVFNESPSVVSIKQRKNTIISSNANRIKFYISSKDTENINKYCNEQNISPAVLIEAVVILYLNKMNGIDDITLGTAVLNRSGKKERSTMGMYVSTVPIRVKIENNEKFIDLCNKITKQHKSSFRHQKYPFDTLIRDIREMHSFNNNLFDVLVSYQNAKLEFKSESNFDFESIWYSNGHVENPLNIHITDRDDAGSFVFLYDYLIELFEKSEIEGLHERLMFVLFRCINEIDITLDKIEFISPEEKKKILVQFNHTDAEYPNNKTIPFLFEEQAKKTPNNIALVFENDKMTYRELNSKADQLALNLISMGVESGNVIGILAERSFEMIIGVIGILKAGATFLPIDPEYPEDRINYMLENSHANILLCKKHLKEKISSSIKKVFIEEAYMEINKTFINKVIVEEVYEVEV